MDAGDLDELAARAQHGDREAFRSLVLETQRDLRLHVAALATGREQVEDVLQATYVTAFEKLGQYLPRRTLRAWLKAIARNHLADLWRERCRLAQLDGDALGELVAEAQLEEVDEDDELRQREVERLATCLERLPARARALLHSRHVHDVPLATLARQFHRPIAALSVVLHRLRARLRQCVEGHA